ncbi:MAG: MBOAT family protein, partial [Planctomycetota bacterium]
MLDYWMALKMEGSPKRKGSWLALSLVGNFALLGWFKYTNFFLAESFALAKLMGYEPGPTPVLDILLPVGISFYTFQSLSYTIDVYRGELKARRSIHEFLMFVTFFPQLVAGPIVRASEFLHQLDRPVNLTWDRIRTGSQHFMVGFIKKVVIADRLSVLVDLYFSQHSHYGTLTAWFAVTAYALQIYGDFSGYSDMAIGLGHLFGYNLPENFRRPYLARNVSEFWRRWHISLSTWLRDYLYIPLGGNRLGSARRWLNLWITMLLGGLWHGANTTFLAWGALHGSYLVAHRLLTSDRLPGVWHSFLKILFAGNILNRLLTFVCVLVGWVFFRSSTMDQALDILSQMFIWHPEEHPEYFPEGLLIIACVLFFHILTEWKDMILWVNRLPLIWKTGVYALFLMVIVLFGDIDVAPFIYFQF